MCGDPRVPRPKLPSASRRFRHPAVVETEEPIAIVASLTGAPAAAIGDRTWATFLIGLQHNCPTRLRRSASHHAAAHREDAAEVKALAAAAAAADRVTAQLHGGQIPLVGRTEAEVSADISRRLVDEGHDKVNFAIVAAGENAASPHHHAHDRVIRTGDVVLCDFGGTMDGYCSDITRCVSIGAPPAEVAEAYSVLFDAQARAVRSATVGTACQAVDAAARDVIADAGYGDLFIHRTGHGIGMEEHEDPYIVSGNDLALAPGHAFSIEPGIYAAGRWGMRLEDIVVATDSGPRALNTADHHLVVVDG